MILLLLCGAAPSGGDSDDDTPAASPSPSASPTGKPGPALPRPMPEAAYHASDGPDAAVWKDVPVLTRFTSLVSHSQAVDQTGVQILACDTGLAVRFVCHDSQPDHIQATTLVRNADQGYDDTVGFMLDTFKDGRGNYEFDTNPLGTPGNQSGQNLVFIVGDPNALDSAARVVLKIVDRI